MRSVLQSRPSPFAQELRRHEGPQRESLQPGNRIMSMGEPKDRMKPVPRLGLVSRIRAQLAAGTYDVDGKLDAALDRLFESLAT